jgi:histidyl-tRNA synthetase
MGKDLPSIPRGTRDFGPAQMKVRNHLFSIIRSVFESFGFLPLETPAMENLSVLTGKYGDEGEQLIYKVLNSGDFLSDVKPEDLEAGYKSLTRKVSEKALRYDLTVPLARYVVMNRHNLSFPFRRYQMQPVWRADRPSFGRYREFWQCDADVVGTKSLVCEAEIFQMMTQVMQRLGIEDYYIKINHRKILAGLAAFCGAPGREAEMSVSLDKLDKVEWPVVEAEMQQRGFSAAFTEKLNGLRSGLIPAGSPEFSELASRLQAEPDAAQGFSELESIFSYLTSFPEVLEKIRFDLSLARGLSYYTGPIFELVPLGVKVGSISGGGRYDELTSVFGVDGIPGAGFSFGIDRMVDLLAETGKLEALETASAKALLVMFDEKHIPQYLALLSRLRSAGIACELYPEAHKLKKQFAYADARKIPAVLVLGEDEILNETLSLKVLSSGEQQTLREEEVIERLQAAD